MRWFGVTALLVPALVTAGCVTSAEPQPTPCGKRIGVFGPLSGVSANLGRNVREGVELAVEQYNAAHRTCSVEMATFDSQGDPKQAPALAQRVVADPQLVGVVGPVFSGESQAAVPLLNQGQVVTISTSATETSLTSHGWTTFHRLLGNDAQQGPALGRYIEKVLHAEKVFVIDDTGAYGHGLAAQVIEALGHRVVRSATVRSKQLDFSEVVAQIVAAKPDTIFYGGYYDEAGGLLRQARDAGVTAAFVAGDGVKDEGFLTRAGQAAAEGAVITCPCHPPETAGGQFFAQYQERFGRRPVTYSAEAYDAANIFLHGLDAGRATRPDMVAYVNAYSGTGVTGAIRFTETGELVGSAGKVWAYRVHAGAIVTDRLIPEA
ncbi:branched chain amino acid ABC transporter substrate-binding protein [Longispora fulva]|uniref:Branched-chain amino acid transport system substrate-binding protein n=1 Tax=Longispora fulva TaxID=619741 RepID=A0A8J7GAU0_9ACTN|nr:branched-chain amino acid ABC transporter substrate-binding protein [Longispora fulva]MBG6134964.1 branched-chain amino acid transport system substrate-binding protein [Longispora fulva]GIG56804.1 branched chain amino acid ABC transporter substrate-binding protein [Longispora fulva]